MTEDPHEEEDTSVRKRRTIQAVIQDKSLTPIKHNTRIQDVMAWMWDKVESWASAGRHRGLNLDKWAAAQDNDEPPRGRRKSSRGRNEVEDDVHHEELRTGVGFSSLPHSEEHFAPRPGLCCCWWSHHAGVPRSTPGRRTPVAAMMRRWRQSTSGRRPRTQTWKPPILQWRQLSRRERRRRRRSRTSSTIYNIAERYMLGGSGAIWKISSLCHILFWTFRDYGMLFSDTYFFQLGG